MAGFPLLGHQISLITKTDVRYEGIMYHIDAKDQTVCLQNVKFFGTENRRPDNQIPASDEITPMVIFKSSEIKEVQVPERPQPFAQPPGYPPQGPPPGYGPPPFQGPPGMYGPPPGYPPPGYGYPPGYPPPYGGGYGGPGQWGPSDSGRPIPPAPQPQPQSSAKASAPQAATGSPALPTPPPVATKPAPVPGSQMVAQASAAAPRPQPAIPSAPAVAAAIPSPDAKQHHERRQQQHHGPRHPVPAPAAVAAAPTAAAAAVGVAVGVKSGADAGHQRSLPGVGGFVRTRKGHGEAAVVGSDFDFEKSNALLEKMKLDQEEVSPAAAVDPALASIKPAYQKMDFFDSLSRDSRQRDDMSHQREVDAQTFGEMTLSSFRRGRGGFRGGRGGHRGYHGRGGDGQGHDGKQHGGGYRGRRDHYQHQPQEH